MVGPIWYAKVPKVVQGSTDLRFMWSDERGNSVSFYKGQGIY